MKYSKYVMPRRCLVGLIFLFFAKSAIAQESGTNSPATNASAPQVAPGDHWAYEVRDEITGAVKFTRTDVVTDVSNNQVAVRFETSAGGSSVIFYDRSWNVLHDEPFRYSPNDGTGVQFPLALGAQWKFAIDAINSRNGLTFRRTGVSRVTGQESITTKAGTFETFVIETNFTGKNVQDPTLINQTSTRTWFSPDVNHWVKRTLLLRRRGQVVQNDTVELTDYGHKKQ